MAELVRTILIGLISGAAGKAALDLTSYADMLLRGRPASDVPANVVRRITGTAAAGVNDAMGTDVVPEPTVADGSEGEPGPRASAAGALSGYAIGLGLGAGYTVARSRAGAVPTGMPVLGGMALSALAMAASDVPAVTTGATSDPRGWPASSWLADIIPHLAYGLVTAASVELLLSARPLGTFRALLRAASALRVA